MYYCTLVGFFYYIWKNILNNDLIWFNFNVFYFILDLEWFILTQTFAHDVHYKFEYFGHRIMKSKFRHLMPMSVIMFTTIVSLCEFCMYQCSDLAMIRVLGHSKPISASALKIDKYKEKLKRGPCPKKDERGNAHKHLVRQRQ